MDAQQLKTLLSEQPESQPDKNQTELTKALSLGPPAIGELPPSNDETGGLCEQSLKADQRLRPRTHLLIQQTPYHFCINDALMEPDFKGGEHVMVDSNIKPDEHAHAFLVSDGHNQMVRLCRVIPNSTPTTLEITAHSKEFEPQQLFETDFDVLGKVVAKINWL